jgi:hypothetical protein
MISKHKNDMAELERVNAELKESLKRCRRIVSDCQSRLAANSNDAAGELRDSETG